MGEYKEIFRENAINGISLLELSENDIRNDLQVKLGPAKVLVKHINILREVVNTKVHFVDSVLI